MSSRISKTVLVTGANGYIGRAVAVAFRQLGYTVFGVVRTNEKAEQARLVDEEIIPIIADPAKVEQYQEYVKKAGIIIENASHDETGDIIKNLVPLVSKSGLCEDNSKKVYIQTVGYRQWPFENLILQNPDIIGTVVRPAFVYGGRGGPVQKAFLFNKPQEGQKLKSYCGNVVLPYVQLNDLVRAYLSIIDNKSKVQGQLFRVGVLDKNITYDKVVKAHAQVMGVEVEQIAQPEHGIEKLIAYLSPILADFDNKSTLQLLGWQPKFSCNILDDLELQYQCYLKWQGKK